MARPAKNTVDYFPFICGEGKKMYYLEETYGNDGFATFVKLLRQLANTEYHYLDLSNKTTKMFLAAKCKISIELLENIINDLVELEKFDEELWNDFHVVWCQDFVDSIQDAYRKRSNQCVTINEVKKMFSVRKGNVNPLNSAVNPLNSAVKPQTILKETIVEKKRETRALEILKIDKQEELDILWMQNKSQISDKRKLVDSFNDKMDLEVAQNKITFEANELMPRFRQYVRSWISNSQDQKTRFNNTPAPDSYESGKLPRK